MHPWSKAENTRTPTPREDMCVRSAHETIVSTRRHSAHPVSVPDESLNSEMAALRSQNHDTASGDIFS